jgi:hypothetical protein
MVESRRADIDVNQGGKNHAVVSAADSHSLAGVCQHEDKGAMMRACATIAALANVCSGMEGDLLSS